MVGKKGLLIEGSFWGWLISRLIHFELFPLVGTDASDRDTFGLKRIFSPFLTAHENSQANSYTSCLNILVFMNRNESYKNNHRKLRLTHHRSFPKHFVAKFTALTVKIEKMSSNVTLNNEMIHELFKKKIIFL